MRAQLVRHPASRAAALAIAVVTVSQALVLIVRGTHPFGAGNVNINDLWHQLLPFHAHLGHLVRGDGPSDWQYNWSSGLGVPWLPDFGTYLAGPGTVAASLAPPAALDLAVTVATTAMMAGAAAMMVAYLYRLRPGGPWWLRGLLGASYGMCAWAVAEAAYVPMWLAGLVALPALALAGEWARSNSHFLASVLIVWAAWWSNYYTAYMATLGAVVLVVLHLVADQVGWRAGLQALLRFAVRGVLGVAIAMVLLLPVLLAIRAGAPPAVVKVERIADDEPELLQHFDDCNIKVGSELRVTEGAPYSGTVAVEVDGCGETLTLGRPAIDAIYVSHVDPE